MAEAFGKAFLNEKGLSSSFEVVSRALTDAYEPADSPASENGIQALWGDWGLDISNHRSTILSSEDIISGSFIFFVNNLNCCFNAINFN
jgi:protein-tyrosine-phosphatase